MAASKKTASMSGPGISVKELKDLLRDNLNALWENDPALHTGSAEAAALIPLDRMLLETDCPYLSPAGHRGETNTSKLISVTAETIAALRDTDAQTVIDACRENGRRLFGI